MHAITMSAILYCATGFLPGSALPTNDSGLNESRDPLNVRGEIWCFSGNKLAELRSQLTDSKLSNQSVLTQIGGKNGGNVSAVVILLARRSGKASDILMCVAHTNACQISEHIFIPESDPDFQKIKNVIVGLGIPEAITNRRQTADQNPDR